MPIVENRPKNEKSVYEEWAEGEGIPIHDGTYVTDLRAVAVAPWERIGGKGALLHHESTATSNDCQIYEIGPGAQLKPLHHMYESMVYVLSGRGATTVWQQDSNKQTFEWQQGSVFALPLNAWYQHFNSSGTEPAKLLAVTNAPVVMNLYQSLDFVFNCDWEFKDRFSGEADYFSREGELHGRLLSTNFVADVRRFELLDYSQRGAGGRNIQLHLAGNTMGAHISEFPVGTYKKGHKHGPGAHVIILNGEGYSLLWREGEEIRRCNWQEGGLIVPGDSMFHQHFNTGTTPARYLALRFGGQREKYGENLPMSTISTRLGGGQIEYEDQDPRVHEWFTEACEKNGAEVRMKDFPVPVRV